MLIKHLPSYFSVLIHENLIFVVYIKAFKMYPKVALTTKTKGDGIMIIFFGIIQKTIFTLIDMSLGRLHLGALVVLEGPRLSPAHVPAI